jgi:chaperone required for assembly of F1-ATPase
VLYLVHRAVQSPAESLVISPDSMPPARLVTRNRRKVNRTIDMGYRKVEELEDQIRRFFADDGYESPTSRCEFSCENVHPPEFL